MNKGGSANFLDLKEELCHYIQKCCEQTSIKEKEHAPWFTAKHLSKDDVETVICLIKESEFFKEELTAPEGNGFPTWKFKGKFGESLTITHYIKKDDTYAKLLLQGKPKLLFLDSIEIVTQLFSPDEISTRLNESGFFEAEIDDEIINASVREIMPNSFEKLPSDEMKKSVLQAIVFYKFKPKDVWYDFTVYTFNSYRVLEGHLRWLLSELSIDYADKLNSNGRPISNSFYMFEKLSAEGDYILQAKYHSNIEERFGDKTPAVVDYLVGIYKIIKEERHKYFHWEKFEKDIPMDETALIEDESSARSVILKCLTKIEEYYKIFN